MGGGMKVALFVLLAIVTVAAIQIAEHGIMTLAGMCK